MGAMSTDSVIRSIVWRDDKIAETDIDFSTISARLADPEQLLWVGLQQPTADDLARLGKELDIDPAAIEDALNHVERPKALRYAHYSFVTVYAAKWAGGELSPASPGELTLTKLSAFTFPHGLVTVWYDPDFSFDEIIDRWSEDSYLSAHGSAMLVHGMLDYVVDGYFEITQDFDDVIEDLEDEVLEQTAGSRDLQRRIYRLRASLVHLRRAVVPMREVVASIMRHRREVSADATLDPWFDDLYDHALRAADWADSLRDLVTTIFETNMSLQDTQLNVVMRQLAAWAAIIAVPTAITGWFGQNVPYFGFNQPYGLWLSVSAADSGRMGNGTHRARHTQSGGQVCRRKDFPCRSTSASPVINPPKHRWWSRALPVLICSATIAASSPWQSTEPPSIWPPLSTTATRSAPS